MRVIDSVKMPGFSQWCTKFVRKAISKIHLTVNGEEIDTIEIVDLDKYHIFLSSNGGPFVIKIFNYIPNGYDENNECCAAVATYVIFVHTPDFEKIECGEIKDHGTALCGGQIQINWSNDPEKYDREVRRFNKLHGLK